MRNPTEHPLEPTFVFLESIQQRIPEKTTSLFLRFGMLLAMSSRNAHEVVSKETPTMFQTDAEQFEAQTGLSLTHHAWLRMNARGISPEAVHTVLQCGRRFYIRGSLTYALGRKEVEQARDEGVDISDLNGVHVVCDPKGGPVLTVYRNRDFKGLRPRHRRSLKRSA